MASTPIDFRKGPTLVTISTICRAAASKCVNFTARARAAESGATIRRASRRHTNNCDGSSPRERAIADTFAPGAKRFPTILILWSCDQVQ